MVQLAQLRALRAVLDTGSFAAAGQRLTLTASAVSQQISTLERALGLTLFDRKPQGVRPSAAAVALGLRTDGVLTQIALLEREAKAFETGTRGVIRVGSFPTASARLIPDTLARLARRRSGVDVLLEEAEPEELLRRVAEGSLDIALVYCYDALPTTWPPDVVRVPLIHESLILISATTTPPMAADLSDVAETPWVSSRDDTAGWRCLETLARQAKFSPRVTYRSNDYDVVRGLVAAGLGIALLPALAYLDNPTICGVPLDVTGAGRTVYLTHRASEVSPLVDLACKAFRQAARGIASELLRPL